MSDDAADEADPMRKLPIDLKSDNAGFFGSNRIVAVESRSDTPRELTVTHTGSSDENRSKKDLNVPARGTATLGEKDWKLKPGDRLSFASDA